MSGSERNSSKAVLKAIRTIVGPEGMRALYAERGGTEISIPRQCDADHWMSRLLGEDVASKVCEHFAIFNADGHLVGNVRCYVPIVNSRIEAVREQVEEEVKQALIAGENVRDIVRDVGVSERKVHRLLKYLRDNGVLPTPPKPHVSPNPRRSVHPSGANARLRAEKLAKVDKMLIAGRTTQSIILMAGVSARVVRARQKHLLDARRLHIGGRATGSSELHSGPCSVSDAIGPVAQARAPATSDEALP